MSRADLGRLLQGADFIECDVVLTSDCGLVCRHDSLLSNTTNADALFPERTAAYQIDEKPLDKVRASKLNKVTKLSSFQTCDCPLI